MAEPFIGQIIMAGFNFAPRGYAFCNGQILSIAQNTALFSLLGTTYGGNGQTTFALPNLQSRVPMHFGQGPGLSYYQLGQMAGSETVTMTIPQMPAHNHAFVGSGTLDSVGSKASDQTPQAGSYLARGVDKAAVPDSVPAIYVPAATAAPLTKIPLGGMNVAGTVGIQGGSQPQPNLPPYLALNYSIALQGIFPSRN